MAGYFRFERARVDGDGGDGGGDGGDGGDDGDDDDGDDGDDGDDDDDDDGDDDDDDDKVYNDDASYEAKGVVSRTSNRTSVMYLSANAVPVARSRTLRVLSLVNCFSQNAI